jgi:hypothetical protein
MAKLTLNVEPDIVTAAKTYAQAHHTSLSKLVTQFFRALRPPAQVDFWTQLHGSLLEEDFQEPGDDLEALRRQHVRRKYA